MLMIGRVRRGWKEIQSAMEHCKRLGFAKHERGVANRHGHSRDRGRSVEFELFNDDVFKAGSCIRLYSILI